jgi:putative ABC transport system substrate-binding protein
MIVNRQEVRVLVRIWASAVLIALLLSGIPGPAGAQGGKPMPRVGVLSPFIGSDNAFFETIRQRLQELGYVEGSYIYRAAEEFDQLQTLAAEMVKLNVAVIVTAGPQGVRAARNATRTIPIVMGNVGDAVDQGFVATLARPGGNVTGLSSLNTELSAKRLELMKQTLPTLSRVAVLREAVGDATPLEAVQRQARALGIGVQVFQIRDADELPSAFAAMADARVGALEILPGSMFVSQLRRIVDLAATTRIPTIFADERFVRAGGLMSYGPDVVALYARSAGYVDRILKGANPANLPVEQPTAFTLAIHLGTAARLGITIPPGLLQRADLLVR